jgi:O-antigen/teichoic acid export membrane protein
VRGVAAETRRTIGIAVAVILVLAPLLGVGSYTALLDLPDADAALAADARRAAIVAFAGGAIGALASPFRSLLVVRGALGNLTRVRTLAVALQVGVTWAGLALTRSLVAPAAGLLVSSIVETVGSALAARALEPGLRLGPVLPVSFAELRSLLAEGAASLAVNIAGILALRFDVVILSKVCPLATVAAYGVASRVVDQSFTLAKQTSLALLPRLASKEDRARAVRVGTALLGGAVAAGMGALVTNGSGLLVAWAGDVAARPETAIAVAILAAATVFSAGHEVAASALTLAGRSAWDAALPLVAGYAINLVFSVIFASRLGVVAVSCGTLVGNAVTSVALWSRARSLLGWRVRAVAWTLAPVLVAGVVALGTGRFIALAEKTGVAWSAVGCVAATLAGLGASMIVARKRAS